MKRIVTALMLAAGCAALLAARTTPSRIAAASPSVTQAAKSHPHALRPRSWYERAQGADAAAAPVHPFTPTDNLPPGSGDVMITTQVFLIYWTPNNTIAATYKNLLTRFVQDLNGTPFLNIVTQYYGNNGTIQNVATYGGSFTDTATHYDAYDSSHTGTPAHPISDDDIRKEVDHAIAVNSWPTGLGNMFFVFTEKGIESCASFGCTPLVDNSYCAYHDHFGSGSSERIYANMPFVNSTGWDCVNTSGEPNNTDADREVSTFSHELFEAITDPRPNDTWTDNSCGGNVACGEIGDKCAYFFPNAANADGSNLTLHGNPYNVQPEWSNGTFTALGSHANDGCTHAYLPADMTIDKSGPSTIVAGSNFDYVIGVQSNGSPTAETPHFTDTLDSHLRFQAITTPAGWTCSTPAFDTTGSIDCSKTNNTAGTDGSMDSGEAANFVVTSRTTPGTANGSTVNNTGKIAWDTLYAPNNATAASVHLSKTSSTSATVISSADLTISKTTVGDAIAGRDFSYVIDVENDGPSDAQNVTVTDTLPSGTSFVSITGSGGFTCTGTGPVTCTRSSMGAGAIASFTLTVHISPSVPNLALISNSATVGSTTFDPNPGNNSASVAATVATSADLSITKTGPSGPIAGSDVTYTITMTNLGPSDAKSPEITDTVPAGTTFVSLTAPGWICTKPAVGTPGPAPIDCVVPSISPGTSATLTLVVHLSASAADGTQLCNSASVSSLTADPVSTNNTSQTCGTVRTSADLALTQSAVTSGSPGKGVATFTLTVTNNGPSDSQKIALVATSSLFTGPAPAINVSAGGTCTVGVQTVTCTWPSLALGASDTVTIAVPWRSAVGQVCDTGNLTAGTPDPNATNNTQTTCIGKK